MICVFFGVKYLHWTFAHRPRAQIDEIRWNVVSQIPDDHVHRPVHTQLGGREPEYALQWMLDHIL